MWDSHRVIPRLLATCCLWQAEGLQDVWRQTSGHIEVVGDLILRDGVTRSGAEKAIGWTVVITELGKPRLDSLDGRISHRRTIINGRGVIVRL